MSNLTSETNDENKYIIASLKKIYGDEKLEERKKLLPEYYDKFEEIKQFINNLNGKIQPFFVNFLGSKYAIVNKSLRNTYFHIIDYMIREEVKLPTTEPYNRIDELYAIIKNKDLLDMDITNILTYIGPTCGVHYNPKEFDNLYENICNILKTIETFLTKNNIVNKYNTNFVFAQFLNTIIFNIKNKIKTMERSEYYEKHLSTISLIAKTIEDYSQQNMSDIEILNKLAEMFNIKKYYQDNNIKKKLNQLFNYKKYWKFESEQTEKQLQLKLK